MRLTREQIVSAYVEILGSERVITDEQTLKDNSADRYYKVENIFGIYALPLPAAVVKPGTPQEVARVLKFANENGINVVPKTGGSATEGGLETVVEDSIVVDGSGMNQILNIDIANMLATVQCGVCLEDLENELREIGYTTGHSPQSKPLAQYGGLVATRSIGQFSTLYGGIEDMLVGVETVFPNGEICRIKNVPRRAAGPDIRHLVIGNEGALNFITEVTVKIFRYYPENNKFYGYLLNDMKTGLEILREVITQGYRPSVARLYDKEDGLYHFRHFSDGRCVLIFVAEGPKPIADATGAAIEEIVSTFGSADRVEDKLIEDWFDNLNWDVSKIEEERVEIRETLINGFTTEISGNWSVIHDIYTNALARIRNEISAEFSLLGGHSSHSYLNGTNMYFVYYYKIDVDPTEERSTYHDPIQNIIVEETLKLGGSMCHHHGVGKHRTHFLAEEYGSSLYMLETLKAAFDPNGIMNRGTIFPLKK
ncbi:FAD-binding oxidoreductase [Cryobacterium algoritolerans]|jgi:alkyldihydroxyacetonephosphate synthase|uniref:FAD-binding oxidoreductase n=1 Tax=Cryobacterium algoritolerans TaxID=1259184 RepID=A0A4R8WIY4_9MICO|nr:FAD-binding oxidoreductase [Cryobacterium algoritolerans]TFC10395.1 FAD-binding oxidoreductase [Cryobacterium algoritolerans]